MPFRTVTAAVTAAVVLMTGLPAGAAPVKPVIRHAGLGVCRNDDGVGRRSCGPWRLWLSDGRVRSLPDAHRPDGDHPAMGVMALSPDGTRAAYFRKSDGVLMIWEAATGKARRTAVRRPESVSVTELTLSPRGRFVGIDGEHLVSLKPVDRIVDTATGKAFDLPRGYDLARFSPDEKHLMATHVRGAVVYKTGTWSVRLRRSAYMMGDLGRDGVTVAKARRDDVHPSKNAVTVRNLDTGKRRTFPLRLRKGEAPYRARWDRAGRLDVLTDSYRGRSGEEYHVYTWYRLDRTTGRLRRLDSFTVTSAVGDVIVAG
ncbi:hypothetical protein [Planomonospora parontospora]|uniref:hypothetical protein n=1 Tax=Planomonospora parontospora TaxID=58119 RepID=UPI0016704C2F|nr:hypothetical protein [Planomonospora parontospora]GGL31477.1 hypothetical protein GCM10014719_36070 [Planomonospora parontospora subsp. antibiotica]GII16579.1 hypothetical protein Ppa05_33050 [Planomonospora parontospora subsp. antibiotica]